ncbi:MAG TPA: hypothetical protein VLL54_19385 [Pyrinomonadaceae bacterium]|nr:hypothetical protein [Pyrinomonadaceae bacterium]
MKRERDPTPEEFEKLLRWLDADREAAGGKYENLRYRLIRIFVARGSADPERLADEVMNRVATRIEKLVTTYDDPAKCFQGFAENVYLEDRRDRREESLDELQHQPAPTDERDADKLEQEDECLTNCLKQLSKGESELFRHYFQAERQAKIRARKNLAVELNLTVNALRIKAHRIRRRLHRCMEECLTRFAGNETIPASNS